jgi:hypothetical protein
MKKSLITGGPVFGGHSKINTTFIQWLATPTEPILLPPISYEDLPSNTSKSLGLAPYHFFHPTGLGLIFQPF